MCTNHKKLGLTVALLATIALSSLTSSVNAQGRGCWMSGHDGGWSNSNLPQQYQLSVEQMTKIKAIRSQYDDAIIPLQRELRALRIEARGYASRSDAEIGKIKSYRKEINNLEDKIADLRLETKAEINKVLTKEQRAYFGDNFGRWDMSGGMMGDMMDSMNMRDMCPMTSDQGM